MMMSSSSSFIAYVYAFIFERLQSVKANHILHLILKKMMYDGEKATYR